MVYHSLSVYCIRLHHGSSKMQKDAKCQWNHYIKVAQQSTDKVLENIFKQLCQMLCNTAWKTQCMCMSSTMQKNINMRNALGQSLCKAQRQAAPLANPFQAYIWDIYTLHPEAFKVTNKAKKDSIIRILLVRFFVDPFSRPKCQASGCPTNTLWNLWQPPGNPLALEAAAKLYLGSRSLAPSRKKSILCTCWKWCMACSQRVTGSCWVTFAIVFLVGSIGGNGACGGWKNIASTGPQLELPWRGSPLLYQQSSWICPEHQKCTLSQGPCIDQ